MPRPSRRSRTFRRVYVKTTTKTVIQYRRRKPKQAHCGSCGKPLPAIPRLHSGKMAAIAKSYKRPERPYGGVLCSACARKAIKAAAR